MGEGSVKRNYQLDNLRAIAILMVVFGHSIILYSSSWDLYTTVNSVPFLDHIKSFINLIQMPLFFALAGFLFSFSVDKRKLPVIASGKARRLLIPYLVIAFCWLLPIRLLLKYPGYKDVSIVTVIFKYIIYGADNGHLWYLLALFWCFIVSALLHKAMKDFKYRLPVILFVSLVMYGVVHVVYVYCFNQLFQNFIWFVLGEVIAVCYSKIKTCPVWFKIVALLIATAASCFCIFAGKTGVIRVIAGILASLFLVITLFLLVPDKENKALSKLSSASFGIYLIHSPLIYITFTFIPDVSPLIVVFVNLFAFGTLSFIITLLIKKSKLRFIIGE